MNQELFGDPTMRERIMRVFKARFEAQQRGIHQAALTWNVVSRKPLSVSDQNAGFAIGIYDTSEKKQDAVSRVECFLNVVFEFHATLAESDDPETWANGVLGEVQRVATLDLNMKEEDGYHLSVDVKEKGNELENFAEKATKVSGVLVVEVQYRHRPGNPRAR
jgi:hypothetical protein